MFIDARQLPDGHRIETDVCIVGAGAAGIAIATEIEGSGIGVTVLESGGLEADPADQALYEGTISGLPYTPLQAARVRYFGGTTNHWSGWCRPLDPIDFERRSWVPNSGWPFGIDELRPYYARAEPLFGLSPVGFDPQSWASDQSPQLGFKDGPVATTLFRITAPARFGELYVEQLRNAVDVDVYLHANATHIAAEMARIVSVSGRCRPGNTFTVSARAFVLATGGIENARLLLNSNDRQRAGLGNAHDLVGRFFMDHPGVTAGMILLEDPDQTLDLYTGATRQVSLMAKIDGGSMERFVSPADKATLIDWATRGADRAEYTATIAPILERQCVTCHNPDGIAFHRTLQNYEEVMRVIPRDANREDGERRDAMAALTLLPGASRRHELLNFCALLEESRGWSEAIDDDSLWDSLGNIVSNFGSLSADTWRKLFDQESRRQLVRVVNIIEPSPNPESRVTLIAERDELGLHRVDLAWRLNDADKATIDAAHDILAHELGRAGVGRMLREFDAAEPGWPDDLSHGWHHMGTTRMHDSPKQGVVDGDCRVHGLANLFVAGSSVFPTYGYAQPTFTIVALALRLSDHLRSTLA